MSYIDREFAVRALSYQPRYREVTGSTFKANCRCKVCGDSQKDSHKARFWAYTNPSDGVVYVKCFNCDYSTHISKYIKEFEPDLHREYMVEKYKENAFGRQRNEVAEAPKEPEKTPVIEELAFCERIDTLPEEHPIVKYVKSRCIPSNVWNRLWFTNKWPALVNSVNPGTYKNETNEPRLVIPIFNGKKEIESFQGRALRKDAPQKYITIKAHPEASKVYGVDKIDERKRVWVMEGPIDSLFIPNSIAITGGTLALEAVPYAETRVWVMDNEPRHPDTIKRMKKLVEAGEAVMFWDNAPWHTKDINEMVKSEGATPEQIESYMADNVAQGLMARMRLSKYAKV